MVFHWHTLYTYYNQFSNCTRTSYANKFILLLICEHFVIVIVTASIQPFPFGGTKVITFGNNRIGRGQE